MTRQIPHISRGENYNKGLNIIATDKNYIKNLKIPSVESSVELNIEVNYFK